MLQPGLKSAISLESLFSYHFINALVMKLGPIQSALTKGSKIQHTNFLDKMTHSLKLLTVAHLDITSVYNQVQATTDSFLVLH